MQVPLLNTIDHFKVLAQLFSVQFTDLKEKLKAFISEAVPNKMNLDRKFTASMCPLTIYILLLY